MSSPIAKENKNFFDKLLISFHRKVSHNNRIELLSNLLFNEIQLLKEKEGKRDVRCLDVGCGDMTLSEAIGKKDKHISFKGIDIHKIPAALESQGKWKNYTYFDGNTIPFEDSSFDIVLFSDVLHHDYHNIETLLKEAKRVSHYVLIKDHFEYGFFSRKTLQLADIIGNYGYGISIPEKYLSVSSYSEMLTKCDLKELRRLSPLDLYANKPLVKLVFRPKYQFISILASNKGNS